MCITSHFCPLCWKTGGFEPADACVGAGLPGNCIRCLHLQLLPVVPVSAHNRFPKQTLVCLKLSKPVVSVQRHQLWQDSAVWVYVHIHFLERLCFLLHPISEKQKCCKQISYFGFPIVGLRMTVHKRREGMKVLKSKRNCLSELGPALTMAGPECFSLRGRPEKSQESEDWEEARTGNEQP